MATRYNIEDGQGLSPITQAPSQDNAPSNTRRFIEIYTLEEFVEVDLGNDDIEETISMLSHSHGCSVNTLPDCFIGSLAFPPRQGTNHRVIHFGFYLNPQRLVFIDSTDECKNVLESLKDLTKLPTISTLRILYEYIKYYINDDPNIFSEIEAQLADIEDNIIDSHTKISNRVLLDSRRTIMKYDRFYQQLTDMCNLIEKDEYLILSKEDRRLFRLLGQRTERLFQRSQSLNEYSLQLRELYQLQIDSEQNKTMRWLTVVTTLVVPLTLITSWYGMNFKHMPELAWPHSYGIIIVICIIIVVVQLFFFKKRKWL